MPSHFNCTARYHRQHGVTLVELMVTLAVLAILLSIAAPNMQSLVASSRLASNTNDFVGQLSQAQMEALRRGIRITVCKTANGSTCTDSGNWSQGWIVFTDPNRNGNPSGQTIIGKGIASSGITIVGDAKLAKFVSYGPDGSSMLVSGSTTVGGTIRVCSTSSALDNDKRTRDLKLLDSGRAIKLTTTGVSSTCPAPQ